MKPRLAALLSLALAGCGATRPAREPDAGTRAPVADVLLRNEVMVRPGTDSGLLDTSGEATAADMSVPDAPPGATADVLVDNGGILPGMPDSIPIDTPGETGQPDAFAPDGPEVEVPNAVVQVQLTWITPGDPDESDGGPEAGSDLDLHLVHPLALGPDLDGDGAPDGWFDCDYDCWWYTPVTDWGAEMVKADTDGAGPETIIMTVPQNKTYRVGVHYWNDHGYGPAFATLRVYVFETLVLELKDVELTNHDMWSACTIEWPSGKVMPVIGQGGEWGITPNYQQSFFYPPCY